MNKNSTAAAETFREGYNCAQAVIAACGPGRGLSRELAIKVAQAFGGGMGRTGGVCGAVTGAMMVIGLEHSAASGADNQAKQDAYRLTRELFARFKAKHGSIICRDLLGCDIGTDEGLRKAHDSGLTKARCPKFVTDAAEIVEDLLSPKESSNATK